MTGTRRNTALPMGIEHMTGMHGTAAHGTRPGRSYGLGICSVG
jgi:hypothetical protein